jgi:acetoin utilization protein AcuC
MYQAALAIAGTVCNAIDRIVNNEYTSAFIPIAGLHHARRDRAAGFCVINDCGIAIEYLRHIHNIKKIAYSDIDAHHGDGVFYSFEDDSDLIFVDFHEDGHFLYPGTGNIDETGKGSAKGTKLNFPMPPGADNDLFMKLWPQAEEFLRTSKPEFVFLQCGADSVYGDPITHMAYSERVHKHAVTNSCRIANEFCGGRVVALGGGGYNLDNIAKTWTAVVSAMINANKEAEDGAKLS